MKMNFFKFAARHWKFVLGTIITGAGMSMIANGEYSVGVKDGSEGAMAATKGYLESGAATEEERESDAVNAYKDWWKKKYQ